MCARRSFASTARSASPPAWINPSTVRAATRRGHVLILLHILSIGFNSGENGGKHQTLERWQDYEAHAHMNGHHTAALWNRFYVDNVPRIVE